MSDCAPPRTAGFPRDDRRVDVLDGARAIMILLVGWFHIWQQSWLTPSVRLFGRFYSMDPLLRSGYIWVDGMILLSGFLLFLTYGQRPMTRAGTARFYRKRFARIFPSYALCVLFFFFLNYHKYADTAHALWDLAAHLTFTHPFWYFTYYGSPINGALWTVGVEVQFYVLFPLILYLYRKKPVLTLAGMCLVGWGFRYWAAGLRDCGMAFNQLPAFMDVYALGFVGAGAYLALKRRREEETPYGKAFFLLAAVLCVMFISRLVRDQAARGTQEMIRYGQLVTRLPLAVTLTVMLVSLAFTFRGVRFLLGNRVMAFLSAISFQFYMYHQSLAVIMREGRWIPSVSDTPNYVGEWPWQPVYTVACFLVPAALSALLTYGFEKPVARLILGRGGAKKPFPTAGAAEENKGDGRDMNQEYLRWLKNCDDEAARAELESVRNDEAQVEDRFYSELTFGTGGLRGVIGAGTNRMNIYTVGRATQGYAVYLKERYGEASVAISHDNRKNSDVFARAAAAIMAGNGIKVYMYSELMPTPMLSWATRVHHCQGGIMVTASHNPAIYNGYKAYGPDGCQLTDDDAHAVEKAIAGQDYFDGIKKADFDEALASGMINYIDQKVIDDFLAMVTRLAPGSEKEAAGLKIVYTPLNGTGRMPVTRILGMNGFSDVTVVPEQEMPDPEFTTCRYPNPEFKEALELGLKLMAEKKADLLLATDPDCDRVGTAVWDNGAQRLITGNEMGVLMLDYLCAKRVAEGTMPKDPVAVKTIVTTDMARRVAESYGVELRDVLTGFKYIGEQIARLEAEGHPERFIMGYEESYGYLTGTSVRDKDAVNASLVICRMAAHYKALGMTLADALRDAEKRFGAFRNAVENHGFSGQAGMIKMAGMMTALREDPPKELMGLKLARLQDYQLKTDTDFVSGKVTPITLPTSNVLKFYYGDRVTAVVRPSGTEPKLKVYHAVRGDTAAEAEELLAKWQEAFGKVTEKLKA